MQYPGGKKRIGKRYAEIIGPCAVYIEPFCGMCSVGLHVDSPDRRFYDSHLPTVSVLRAVRDGWDPPSFLSEDEYHAAKSLNDNNPLKAFAGFGCSFSGKWFGGYARGGEKNYAKQARASLLKMAPLLAGCVIECRDARVVSIPIRSTVLLDPPYLNTEAAYGGSRHGLDVWGWAAEMSKTRTVYVCEYSAPPGWWAVDAKTSPLSMGTSATRKGQRRTEKLYQLRPERSPQIAIDW